jgi:hypothetical protein
MLAITISWKERNIRWTRPESHLCPIFQIVITSRTVNPRLERFSQTTFLKMWNYWLSLFMSKFGIPCQYHRSSVCPSESSMFIAIHLRTVLEYARDFSRKKFVCTSRMIILCQIFIFLFSKMSTSHDCNVMPSNYFYCQFLANWPGEFDFIWLLHINT